MVELLRLRFGNDDIYISSLKIVESCHHQDLGSSLDVVLIWQEFCLCDAAGYYLHCVVVGQAALDLQESQRYGLFYGEIQARRGENTCWFFNGCYVVPLPMLGLEPVMRS